MAVTEWSYNRLKNHIGNSDYFTSNYIKKSSRFEFLQCKPSVVLTEKPVIKHISVPLQAKLIF